MEIILIQDVDNLGGKNELVKVKNGYARNFLIPQKFAIEANPTNLKKLQEALKVAAKKEAPKKAVAVKKAAPVKKKVEAKKKAAPAKKKEEPKKKVVAKKAAPKKKEAPKKKVVKKKK